MSAARRLLPCDVTILVDGAASPARAGESIAAALAASDGWPPFFCGMGVCFACVATVEGIPGRRTCIEPVREGLQVERDGWEGRLDAAV